MLSKSHGISCDLILSAEVLSSDHSNINQFCNVNNDMDLIVTNMYCTKMMNFQANVQGLKTTWLFWLKGNM